MNDVDSPAGGTRAAWRVLAITLVAFALSMLLDKWAFDHVQDPKVYERDWGRLLRVIGFMGTWVALAIAVGLQDRGARPSGAEPGGTGAWRPRWRSRWRSRGWLLVLSPGLAGLAAEVLKLVIRRERPAIHDGFYGFRAWSEGTLHGGGLALPSSHAAVAFGGAAMVARLFPRARWVGYALAAGCGATRVMARAHFVSDVVLAAGLGWLVAWWLTRRQELAGDAIAL